MLLHMVLKIKFNIYLLPILVIILGNCSNSEMESTQSKDTLVINDTMRNDSNINNDTVSIKKDSLPKVKKDSIPNEKKAKFDFGTIKPGAGSGKGRGYGNGSSNNPRGSSEPGKELTFQQRKELTERRMEEKNQGITERKELIPKAKDTGLINNPKF